MESDFELSSLVGNLDDVSPLDVHVRLVVAFLVVDGNTMAAVANGNNTPLRVVGQELVLTVARKLFGNFEELVVCLSRRVASLGLVNHYHLSLVIVGLCVCVSVCVCVCVYQSVCK